MQELLSLHWDKQAVVFLKDVKFDHLQALVDYMYRGEVNVSQDQLAAFLNTAEALKIKGLADGDRDRKNEKKIIERANARSSSPSGVSRPTKRVRKQSKEDSSPPSAEKNQLPHHQLPSLVRIPPITFLTPISFSLLLEIAMEEFVKLKHARSKRSTAIMEGTSTASSGIPPPK